MLDRVKAAWAALTIPPERKASATGRVSWVSQGTLFSGGALAHDPRFARDSYATNIIAHLCVRLVSDAFASLPLLTFRGEDEAPAHALAKLLASPNPLQGQDRFLQAVAGWHLITGNSWIEAVRVRKGGLPMELYAHDPQGWERVLAPDGLPILYRFRGDRGSVDFPLDSLTRKGDVLHVGGFNPLRDAGGNGLSPMAAASRWITLDNTGADLNVTLARGVNPSLALSFDASLSDEEGMRARQMIEDRLADSRRSGLPLITMGKMTVERLSDSLQDMQWTEGMHEAARRICAAWNVPHILVVPGESTYANREQAHLELWEHTVLPFARLLLSDLVPWWRFLYRDDGLDVRIDEDAISALEPRRITARADALAAFKEGVLSLNETRLVLGYGPAEESDDPAEVAAALRNALQADMLAEAQADALANPQAQQQPPGRGGIGGNGGPPLDDADDDGGGRGKMERREVGAGPSLYPTSDAPTDDRHRVPAGSPEGGRFLPGPTAQGYARYLRTGRKADEEELAGNLDDALMVAEVLPVVVDTLERFAGEVYRSLSLEVAFDVTDPRVSAFLRDLAGVRIRGIGETTRAALGAALADVADQGGRFDQYVAAIGRVMQDAGKTRAVTIATTETTRAVGFATQHASEDVGVERRMWLSTRDADVRDTHRALDGQTKPTREPFKADGISGMHPGAMSGGARNNVNCRCVLIPIADTKAAGVYASEAVRGVRWKAMAGEVEEHEARLINAVRQGFAAQERALVVDAYRAQRRMSPVKRGSGHWVNQPRVPAGPHGGEWADTLGNSVPILDVGSGRPPHGYGLGGTPADPGDPAENGVRVHGTNSWYDVSQGHPDSATRASEQKAKASYQGSGYVTMNNTLRGHPDYRPEDMGEHTATNIRALDGLMQRAALSEDAMVYRGVTAKAVGELREGRVFSERGFMSTTTNGAIAKSFQTGSGDDNLLLVIHLPKGSKAVSMISDKKPGSFDHEEKEILVARDGMFKINRIDKDTRRVYATLIAHAGDKKKSAPGGESKAGQRWWETWSGPTALPDERGLEPSRVERFVTDVTPGTD